MFTLNNYTEDDIDRLCDMDPDKAFVVIGLEVAPTTGTPHLQGYFQFKDNRTVSAVSRLVPRAHIEVAVKSPMACCMYCIKDGQWLSNDASKVDEICQYKTPPTARLADVPDDYKASELSWSDWFWANYKVKCFVDVEYN